MARQIYRAEVYDPIAELAALGLQADLLDLRPYFGEPERMTAAIARFDLVWVMGGNGFVLRRAMKQSGFDGVIVELLEGDAIVYGGCAAGAVVAGPTLRGIELMDDPCETARGLRHRLVWGGLGLTDLRHRPALPLAPSRERPRPTGGTAPIGARARAIARCATAK